MGLHNNGKELLLGAYINPKGNSYIVLGIATGHDSPEVLAFYIYSSADPKPGSEVKYQKIGSFRSELDRGGYAHYTELPWPC